MVKAGYNAGGAGGEYVSICCGQGTSDTTAALQPFGLLGQWLGGTFDGLGQNNQVSVWMGPDSEYEVLAPGFKATSLGTASAASTAGTQVLLYGGSDGRLALHARPKRWFHQGQCRSSLRD